MDECIVSYKGGMEFEASARHHIVTIDLSVNKGGMDRGMNPPEVFLASLGSCVGVYVVRYCQSCGLNTEGMTIKINSQISDDKTKIQSMDIQLDLPKTEIGKRAKAILEVAHHCLIHNTILGQPKINIVLKALKNGI